MRWNRGTWWCFATTLVLMVGLAAWFSLGSGGQANRRTATAQTTPAESKADTEDPDGSSFILNAGLVALLIIPVGAIVIIARLQQRRKAAYREAARTRKEEVRAAEISANRRDQNLS